MLLSFRFYPHNTSCFIGVSRHLSLSLFSARKVIIGVSSSYEGRWDSDGVAETAMRWHIRASCSQAEESNDDVDRDRSARSLFQSLCIVMKNEI